MPFLLQERIEVRVPFDKLRMTSLFAMVSGHGELVEPRTATGLEVWLKRTPRFFLKESGLCTLAIN